MPVTFCSSGQKQGQSLTTPHAFWPKQVQAGNCHLYECMPLHSLISRFTTKPIFTTCIWFGICCRCSPRQHQFDCLSTNAIHFSSSCHPYPATAVDLKVSAAPILFIQNGSLDALEYMWSQCTAPSFDRAVATSTDYCTNLVPLSSLCTTASTRLRHLRIRCEVSSEMESGTC